MSSEIKPCPSCGGGSTIATDANRRAFFVACTGSCMMEGPYTEAREEAIAKWNRLHMLPEGAGSPTREQEGWGLPLRVVRFDRPVGTPDSEVEEWIAIVGAEWEDDDSPHALIEFPTELLDEWVPDFLSFVVRSVNALAGLNPEALGKLVGAVEESKRVDDARYRDAGKRWRHSVEAIYFALAKLKGGE